LAKIDFTYGPFLPENITDITLTPSAASGDITLTASSAFFRENHVGCQFALKHSTTWGFCKVTAYTDSTHVNATVLKDFGGTGATKLWREGAFSDTMGPNAIALFEGRLIFGGTANWPQSIWGSCVQMYEKFAGTEEKFTVEDDDNWMFTFATGDVNLIQWLASAKNLLVGGRSAEFVCRGEDYDDTITPSSVVVKKEATYGSANIAPVSIGRGQSLLFVQRGERKVLELTYDFVTGYFAPDMTILAEHITKGGLVEMAYQFNPDSVVWIIRKDGVLLGLTYQKDHDVIGWHKHTTQGYYESVAVIPGEQIDEVWVLVRRTIGGETKRYIEWFKNRDFNGLIEDAFFVDSGLTYYEGKDISGATKTNPVVITCNAHGWSNGDRVYIKDVKGMTEINDKKFEIANVTTDTFELKGINGTEYTAYESGGIAALLTEILTGMDHLAGEEVALLVNGAAHVPKTVSDAGEISLDREAWKVHAGLGYTSILETMRIEKEIGGNTIQGKVKRITEMATRLYETVGCKIGFEGKMEIVPFRDPYDKMDVPLDLFTGDKISAFPAGFERDARIRIVQDLPLPITVIAIMPRMEAEAGD